jgi:eukaryotic-like serine/threonine-protein kinase
MSEETLLREARGLTPSERAAYLEANCADTEMRRRIEDRLKSLQSVAGEVDPTVLTGANVPQPPGMPEQAGVVIGPYKLLQTLGEGGMGTVWVAEQSEPVNRRVALKLIKIGLDTTDVLRRFEAERQALALMEHQNIAKVLDAGTTPQGRPYFAMDLIKGIPITKYCDQEHLTPRERLELFIPVCQAVQHAHQKGVIHRDLKPSNVLIALYDGKPVPKVIDFGVAKATSQKLTERTLYTEVGQIVGTLEYMAPEQAELNNLDIDTRADVYSLGVILYELLAGSPPFTAKQLRGAAFTEMLRMIREVEPPKPSTRLSSSDDLPSIAASRKLEPRRLTRVVHGDLDWIVMKALEKDRARRYETANGFAMDIQRYLADEPVSAGPPGAGYRLRKLVRRKKGPVLAAAAVAVALVGGVAAVLVVQDRANRALGAKNEELAAKNTELAAEQDKVQARFETAQKAIALFHTGVSEDMLLKNDQFKELRTKLLKEAAGFYADLEKLLAGQTDAKSRRLLAAGYYELGELTEKIGSQPEALAVHRQALALRRELAAAAGANVETRLDVGRGLWKVGKLLDATGDKAAALAAFEEQRKLSERLAEEDPSDAVRAVLARSHSSIGRLLSETGKPGEALASYEKALAIQQELADANPAVNEFQTDLAANHNYIGQLLFQTGKPAESLAAFRKALAIRQQLADAYALVTGFQRDLALSHNNIGVVLSPTGKPGEALAAYEKALAIQQKLADANPAVAQFQQDVALSHNNIGALLLETGKPGEALAAFHRALAIQQRLADANPAVIRFQVDLALSHNNIGAVLTQISKLVEALAAYEKALAIRQKLADANPSVTLFQQNLATSHNSIGRILLRTAKPGEALAAFQRALAARQKLADANPSVIEFQQSVAESQTDIAGVLWESGKPAESLAAHQKALAMRQKLADANPTVLQFLRDVAESLGAIGSLFAAAGKDGEAIEYYTREETILQKLATAESALPGDRNGLAICQTNVADLLRKLGRRVEARAACERALALQEPLIQELPQIPDYRGGLAATCLRTGQVQCDARDLAAAAATWRRAIALYEGLKSPYDEQIFFRACCHAGLSELGNRPGSGVSAEEGRAETDRAVSWLRKAVTAGYSNPDAFRIESALDPLRGREDFKKLVAELEMKAKARSK